MAETGNEKETGRTETGDDRGGGRAVTDSWEAPWWLRIGIGVGVAILIVGGIVWALRGGAVPVDLVTAERGTLEVAVEENGRTRVRDRYVVSAPISGSLLRVDLRVGDRVRAGEVLFRIASPEAPLPDTRTSAQLRARVAAAEARVEAAQAEAEAAEAAIVEAQEQVRRQEVLAEVGGGSESALERARAALRARQAEVRSTGFRVRAAEGEVEDLRLALERPGEAGATTVPGAAPVDGTVLQVMRESSGPVQGGSPVLEIGDPDALEVVVDFLSEDAVRIAPGMEADITGWGRDGTLAARVRTVEPSAFTRVSALGIEEQRVNVILDPSGPGWDVLGDGYRVEARVLIERLDDVLLLPSGSVFRMDDGWAVFVVREARAEQRTVEVGSQTPNAVEITSGLEEGDRVVLYPGDQVEDGVRVQER